jgi:hypothetical protein
MYKNWEQINTGFKVKICVHEDCWEREKERELILVWVTADFLLRTMKPTDSRMKFNALKEEIQVNWNYIQWTYHSYIMAR